MSSSRGAIPRVAWVAVGVAAGAAATTQRRPGRACRSSAGLPRGRRAMGAGDPCRHASGRRASALRRRRRCCWRCGSSPAPRRRRRRRCPRTRGRGPRSSSPSDRRATATRSRRLRLLGDGGEVAVAATLPAFPSIAAGDVVEVDGRLRPPPDDDAYGAYLRRSGASGTPRRAGLTLGTRVADGPPDAPRCERRRACNGRFPSPRPGSLPGSSIGLRERVDRALAADFATAGVSHVVAISGWNIAIVAALVAAVLRGRSRRLLALGILLTVVAYVVAAGASPSVVRAAVMAGVVLLARESGRAGRAPAALGIAAAVLLLSDPAMIGDAGFRLSVMATAGLLAWANPLARHLARRRWRADAGMARGEPRDLAGRAGGDAPRRA